MSDRYDFQFNQKRASEFGVLVQKRPDMPGVKRDISFIEIPGSEYPEMEEEFQYESIEIPISCAFKESPENWNRKVRQIRSWLNGPGELILSESPEAFYKVWNVTVDKFERPIKRHGIFTANFICRPFEYMKEGIKEKTIQEVSYNPYDICHPIYKITGNGICKLNVNGKIVTASVSDNIVINSELMLAYRDDGTKQNKMLTGDYEDLYLQPGVNSISMTSGFSVKVIPNWRCF
ncbi:MAG: hypothetical protein SOY12_00660 [Schaedlerella sp.]|nr:hypothetical protein [Lachnospiraceae bacterium]MDY4201571.1 hypothetical protein [Schaedlerella sp.]